MRFAGSKRGACGQLSALALAFAALAGCSVISDSGPSRRTVESQAIVTASDASRGSILDYALVDLNRFVLPWIDDPGPGSLFRTFGAGHGPAPEIRVGIGDTLQVTLFEAQAGGLFIPVDAGSRPGNFVSLPSQTVDAKGFITVPYAGQVRALNRGTPAIQRDIIDRLKDRAIEPQAIVAIVSQSSTQVTVVGDVGQPGKISINPAGDHVLDAISRAGGIRNPGYEEFVTLQRNGLKGTVYFLNLVKDPHENVFVAPGDTLYVYQYQRAFMAFGATGVSGQFKFLQENLTLNDAVGKAGGLIDSRAEPGQVFVYRIETRSTLEKMGVDVSKFPAERQDIPTIFRVNFRDPSGFFAARRFPMRDNDIIYVDNADEVEIAKFLTLINTVANTTSGAAYAAASTKASVLYLQNRCSATSGFVNCP
jgi:polysaccharide biosynthesis/export protein